MLIRPVLPCLLLLALSASCSRDPNVVKLRYLNNGNNYFKKGSYKQASIMYRTALQKDAKFGEAYYRLALTDLKMQQPVAAVASLRRAVELLKPDLPERTDARIKLADIYLDYLERSAQRQAELLDEAGRTANDLVKADPKSSEGHRLKGRLYFVAAQTAASDRIETKMKEQLQNSIVELRMADSLKPFDKNTVLYLARVLTADEQYAEAERIYLASVGREKQDVQTYLELYRMYMFQNRPDQAEAILKKAIDNNPKRFELLISLAQHYYSRKRRDEVMQVIENLKSHAKEYPQAFEQVGAFYFRLGDGAEAIRQYEEGIKANPERKDYYQKAIIEVLMAQGRKEDAKKMNDSILSSNPKDNDALGLQASLLLDKGELQNAVSQLQTVVTRSPSNFVAHFNLGRGLAEKGELEEARGQFAEALRLRPDYNAARLALAQIQLAKREYDMAIKTADEALTYEARNVPAKLIRVNANMGLNRMGPARDELKQILDANPNSQDALILLATVFLDEKKYKEAEDIYRKSYDLNPANSRGLMGLMETMMAQNQPDRAMQLLRTEIQKYPTRLEFHMALANISVRAEKYDLALAEFNGLLDKVDRKSSTAADLYIRIGETYRQAQNYPAAIEALQKAREILPNNGVVLNALALMFDLAGQKKEAKAAYESALRIEGENPVALNNLAYIIAESVGGDLDQALTFAQRANQKLPQASEIADTLGWIYLKKNLPDNALEIFKSNVTKHPANSTYHYHLAMALHQKGDKVKAKQELQTALSHNPSKEEAANIKELMAKI
jgi:tetratricopeptide (TPR) repeat protein